MFMIFKMDKKRVNFHYLKFIVFLTQQYVEKYFCMNNIWVPGTEYKQTYGIDMNLTQFRPQPLWFDGTLARLK